MNSEPNFTKNKSVCLGIVAILGLSATVHADTFVYDGKTYIYMDTSMSWADAEYNCVARFGGHLVSYHNASTMAAVYAGVGAEGMPWIGLTDKVSEDTWVWTDGSSVDFTPWSTNQPDNWRSNENCAQANAAIWNDNTCSNAFTSICQEGPTSESQETKSLLYHVVKKISSASSASNGSRDGVAGFVLVMSILGAVVLVVAVGTVAYKKSKRMAMSDHGSDFLKPENSCVNVKSYGSTHDI
eukprot:CAMPEP_0114227860 /NCGR_PEP_ID=MMETSP0058-20121206/2021_1 /TAXON_ID=36894 /ORGANISM="Pyramimonas parkeae, CCMP726" /LENGTH=240 /DNA_ID=CAMNT_0001338741 /DNA_START=123 /DNA_END=845 /DNA_ORIENTATION=+